MRPEIPNPLPRRAKWLVTLFLAVMAGLVLAPLALKREPVRLTFLGYTNSGDGIRTALVSLTNDSSKPVIFLSNGGVRPYYQLIEYLTLSTNPMMTLITNYNLDAFFHTTQGTLQPHAGVVFPVQFPNAPTNSTIIVNYYPPTTLVHDALADLRASLGRPTKALTASYANLSLKPPGQEVSNEVEEGKTE